MAQAKLLRAIGGADIQVIIPDQSLPVTVRGDVLGAALSASLSWSALLSASLTPLLPAALFADLTLLDGTGPGAFIIAQVALPDAILIFKFYRIACFSEVNSIKRQLVGVDILTGRS